MTNNLSLAYIRSIKKEIDMLLRRLEILKKKRRKSQKNIDEQASIAQALATKYRTLQAHLASETDQNAPAPPSYDKSSPS